MAAVQRLHEVTTTPTNDGTLRRGAWLQHGHANVFGRKGFPQRFTPLRSAGVRAALSREISKHAGAPREDIYAFGVYTGTGMAKIAATIAPFRKLWGFDSFQGIPEESDARETERNAAQNAHFRVGGYSAADALGEWNATRLMGRILKRIRSPKVELIRGAL